MSQAEDMLSEVPDEDQGAGVSTDLAEPGGADEGHGGERQPGSGVGGDAGPDAEARTDRGAGDDGAAADSTGADADAAADSDVAAGGDTALGADAAAGTGVDSDAGAADGDAGPESGTGGADGEAGPGQEAAGDGLDASRSPEADLEQEGDIAADYVEGLLDIADLDGDIDMDVEGDRAVVSVVGATLDELVGRHGEVLEALQELTRLAVHRQTGVRARLMLDIGGYRARRRAELAAVGRDAAEEVGKSGVPRPLEAMTPFERKVVHDAVAAAGCRSESEGEEPNRRVVVYPAE